MVDWIEKPIGELFSISGGRSASRAQLSDKGYFYLHYGDIHASTKPYIDTNADRVNIPRLDVPLNKVSTKFLLQDGDVVFVDASEDDIGASKHIVVRNADNVPFISGLHTIVAKPLTDEIDKAFREYCFQTAEVQSQFKQYAAGTKVTGVSKTTIKKIFIPFPKSLPEQRAIAAALSDVDGYIAALERLIAKKSDIKKGAMQELLRVREDWQEQGLSTLFDIRDGTHATPEYVPLGYPLVTSKSLKNGAIDVADVGYISKADYEEINKRSKVDVGDILFAMIGTVGNPVVVKVNSDFAIKNIALFKPYEGTVTVFFLQLFQSSGFMTMLENLQTGSNQGFISLSMFRNIKLQLPTLTEQAAIAAILSDMDAEIDALTIKLAKVQDIKQGMMQELLTGRIRLVNEAEKKKVTSALNSVTKVIPFKSKNTEAAKSIKNASTKVQKAVGHNTPIEDAVILAAVTERYATEQYPLAPFYAQKFPYLLHRHMEGLAKGYIKKAAGPYKPELKYRTALPIGLKNRYVDPHKATYQGQSFVNLTVGDNIVEAKNYFAQWHGDEPLKWLEQFRYIKNRRDELELLTTVDMAMVELRNTHKPITILAIKEIIKNSEEWKAKLKRELFSDDNIKRAVKWSNELFGTEVNQQ